MPSENQKLVFLHTSPAHVPTFTELTAVYPTLTVQHIVDESLLDEARTTGMTPDLQQRITRTVQQATDDGAAMLLCTCSTIGDAVKNTAVSPPIPLLRIDRPMMETAVSIGSPILIAATLQSTLEPTRTLLTQVAAEQGKTPQNKTVLCADAWSFFEAGDLDGYAQSVAQTLRQQAGDAAVIILAQASMAPAVTLCADLGIPVLSSPELGVKTAVSRLTS